MGRKNAWGSRGRRGMIDLGGVAIVNKRTATADSAAAEESQKDRPIPRAGLLVSYGEDEDSSDVDEDTPTVSGPRVTESVDAASADVDNFIAEIESLSNTHDRQSGLESHVPSNTKSKRPPPGIRRPRGKTTAEDHSTPVQPNATPHHAPAASVSAATDRKRAVDADGNVYTWDTSGVVEWESALKYDPLTGSVDPVAKSSHVPVSAHPSARNDDDGKSSQDRSKRRDRSRSRSRSSSRDKSTDRSGSRDRKDKKRRTRNESRSRSRSSSRGRDYSRAKDRGQGTQGSKGGAKSFQGGTVDRLKTVVEALEAGLCARLQTIAQQHPSLAPFPANSPQLPPLQLLAHELQIRIEDWKVGAVSSSYCMDKLQALALQVDRVVAARTASDTVGAAASSSLPFENPKTTVHASRLAAMTSAEPTRTTTWSDRKQTHVDSTGSALQDNDGDVVMDESVDTAVIGTGVDPVTKRERKKKTVNPRLSSMLNTWAARRQEDRAANAPEDPVAVRRRKAKELRDWELEQIASGHAERNANFVPLGQRAHPE